MKKFFIPTISAILTIILCFAAYFFIWGGKPETKNFKEVSNDYEAVAQLALDYYNNLSPKNEYIILDIKNNELKYENNPLALSTEQKFIVEALEEKFNYLKVYEDAVFFCEDERKHYGLVYSKRPLFVIYREEIPQHSREYHRINNNWYEWGSFGW